MSLGWKLARAVKTAVPAPLFGWLERRFERAAWLLPERWALSLLYYKSHHRWPDLDHPRAMSEKVVAMRLADPPFERYADKLRVKDWVASKIGAEHVIPTLWSGKRLPPREQRDWPLPFIIKTNNGCGGHVVVRDKPDWDSIEEDVEREIARDYAKVTGEHFYGRIDPMLLVEPLIGGNELPNDYKFFMFSGRLGMILIVTDRANPEGHRETYFHPDFTPWKRSKVRPSDPEVLDRPDGLDEMIDIAEKLSQGFAFVRVDLYREDGQTYFGEMTFYSAAGLLRIEPAEEDYKLGALWEWGQPFVPGDKSG